MVQLLEHPSLLTSSHQDIRVVLVDAHHLRWLKFRKELARCQKRFSEKSVHDLRVAIRRLVSTLDILMVAVPDASIRKARRMLKKHFSEFGPLRDTQVQILSVTQLVPAHPMLESFLTVLRLRERRLVKQLDKHVKEMNSATIENAIAAVHTHLQERLADPVVLAAARAAATGAAAMAFARTVQLHSAIDPSASDTIHRLRVAFKKFRYMVEALQPLLPGVTDAQLTKMHDYQVRMGDIQDIEVLMTNVRGYAKRRGRATTASFTAVERVLARRRTELIEAFLTRSRELREFWRNPAEMRQE